jgi:pentatricopeptide repeat protein
MKPGIFWSTYLLRSPVNAMMHGLYGNFRMEEAFEMLDEMSKKGLQPMCLPTQH